MTERFHFLFSLSCIGEGNGNPLQCSLDHKFSLDRELIHTAHCCTSFITLGTYKTTKYFWMKNEWAPYILSSCLDLGYLAGPEAQMNGTSSP